MSIPDLIFGIGGIFFVLALLPTVFSNRKPSIWTSAPTTIILYVFAVTYFSLDYYFAFAVTFATATLWDIIAIQTLYQMEIEGKDE